MSQFRPRPSGRFTEMRPGCAAVLGAMIALVLLVLLLRAMIGWTEPV